MINVSSNCFHGLKKNQKPHPVDHVWPFVGKLLSKCCKSRLDRFRAVCEGLVAALIAPKHIDNTYYWLTFGRN